MKYHHIFIFISSERNFPYPSILFPVGTIYFMELRKYVD